MILRVSVRILLLFLLCCSGAGALAEDHYFLFVDGIQGGSPDPDHEDWIDVTGMMQGLQSIPSGQGGGASLSFDEISLLKTTNIDSPLLHELGASRQMIPDVKIDVCRDDPQHGMLCYYRLQLDPAVVSSISVSANTCAGGGSSCGAHPVETITFAYRRIRWTYTEFEAGQAGQTHTGGFDLQTGEALQ